MYQKKIICMGLAVSMMFSSCCQTFASIKAGQYYKIQYTHNKKYYSKKAVPADVKDISRYSLSF